MAGYLDHYGAGDERREKILKTAGIALAILLVGGGILFFIFHNYRQERQVRHFFELMSSRDYKAAYALWGCTDAKPCEGYPFASFMQDWGPASANAQSASQYHIAKSRSCDNGVILTVDVGPQRQEKLWVNRTDLTIGFSPFPTSGCPIQQR
jgi:hypothetical protein